MGDPRLELHDEGLQARLAPGRGTNGGYSLVVDEITQSHVNPDDPLDLQLEYVRMIAAIVEAWRPGNDPLAALHLGAGALTIPRYLAETRPGSRQHVVELHRPLLEFVLDVLPLREGVELTAEYDDARRAVDRAARRAGGYDLAVVDVFSGSVAPPAVGTVEFFASLRDLLAPGALVIVNTLVDPGLAVNREMAATLAIGAGAGELTVVAAEAVFEGAPGNLVLAEADPDGPLGVREIADRLASNPRPVAIVTGDAFRAFVTGAEPRHDPSPD